MKVMSVKLPGPFATTYICDNEGEGVPEHTHTYPHSCTVISGSVLATCGGKEKTLSPGQSVMFPTGIPHSIKALSPGTIFTNAALQVMPSEEASYTFLNA